MELQDRSETLATFQAISGEGDMEKAIQILERNHWNLGAAMQEITSQPGFSSQTDPSTSQSNSPAPSSFYPPISSPQTPQEPDQPTEIRNNNNNNNNNGGPIAVVRNGTMWTVNSLMWVFRLIFTFIGTLLPFGRLFGGVGGLAGPGSANPIAEVANFVREYEEAYGGPETHPPFHQGSYNSALQKAKRDMKFVLVYLHSPNHLDTPKFCRDTLGNREVIDLINNNFVFWGSKVQSSQGYRLSFQLRASTYPFFAVISPHSATARLLAVVEGFRTTEQFITQMTELLNLHSSILNNVRRQQQERERNRKLREEQDSAYQEALAEDREKARKQQEEEDRLKEIERAQREEEERRRQEEERLQQEQIRAEQEKERKKREREQRLERFATEPSGEGTTYICFKFPSGSQKKRRFNLSDPIQTAYDYIEICQDEVEVENYWLASNFPRVVYSEPNRTFQELQFPSSTILFLQEK